MAADYFGYFGISIRINKVEIRDGKRKLVNY